MKADIILHEVDVDIRTGYNENGIDHYAVKEKAALSLSFIDKSMITPFDKDDSYGHTLFRGILVLSEDELIELVQAKVTFTYVRQVKVTHDISRHIMEIAEKPITITPDGGGDNYYNTKCEVHMPGQALSLYNELMLIEDSCTDIVQGHLASGWRIIAACPQPNQRRPDYILGRFNPKLDIDASAERGQ